MKVFLRLFLVFLLSFPFQVFQIGSASALVEPDSDIEMVLVTLKSESNVTSFTLSGDYFITNGKKEEMLSSGSYNIKRMNGQVTISSGNRNLISGSSLTLQPKFYSLENTAKLGSYNYLGRFIITPNRIVNELPLEHYLYGVVPHEIGENSLFESLKVQAVSARTYAKANENLDNTTNSQVYKGFNPNHVRSILAVNETNGEILMNGNKPAIIYYSSSNGGFIKAPKNVWAGSGSNQNLSFKKDPYDGRHSNNPDNSQRIWNYTIVKDLTKPGQSHLKSNIKDEIKEKVSLRPGESIKLLSVTDVDFDIVNEDLGSNHLLMGSLTIEFEIVDSENKTVKESSIEITKSQYNFYLQKFFGNSYTSSDFKSPNVLNIQNNENEFIIEGSGFGHGIGLSQNGARYMASLDKNYSEILEHYFPNYKIVRVNPLELPSNPPQEGEEEDEASIGDPVNDEEPENGNSDPNTEDGEIENENLEEPDSEEESPPAAEGDNEDKDESDSNVDKDDQEGSGEEEEEEEEEEEKPDKPEDNSYSGDKDEGKNSGNDNNKDSNKDKDKSNLQEYVIKPGDTLWDIALKYGTTVDSLIDINQLTSSTIFVGQKLLINTSKIINDEDQKSEELEKFHQVKSGDTLWKLSLKYSLSVSKLMELNNLKSDIIFPGQKLIVSGDNSQTIDNKRPVDNDNSLKEKIHIVKPGDTLWDIAQRYGLTVDQIKNLNKISGSVIHPGQEINLKNSSGKEVNPKRSYLVKRGDTLWGISRKFNTTVKFLVVSNSLSSTTIFVGQELRY